MKKNYLRTLSSVLFLYCMTFSPVVNGHTTTNAPGYLSYTNPSFYQPLLENEFKLNNHSTFNRLGLLVPVKQTLQSLWYITMLSKFDHLKSIEGNLGIGYRIMRSQAIVGGFMFYDIKKLHHQRFQQITVGGELLYKHIELRGNIYIPFASHKTYPHKSSHDMVALPGFDVSIGGTLPQYNRLTSHMIYYHFKDRVYKINGISNRTSLQLNRILFLEGQISFDKLRGVQLFTGIKFRYLIGHKTLFNNTLKQKMTTLPIRDLDIITMPKIKQVYTIQKSQTDKYDIEVNDIPPPLPPRTDSNESVLNDTPPPLPPRADSNEDQLNDVPPQLPPRIDEHESSLNGMLPPPLLPKADSHNKEQWQTGDLKQSVRPLNSSSPTSEKGAYLKDIPTAPPLPKNKTLNQASTVDKTQLDEITLPASPEAQTNTNQLKSNTKSLPDTLSEVLVKRRQAIAGDEEHESIDNLELSVESTNSLLPILKTPVCSENQPKMIPTAPPLPSNKNLNKSFIVDKTNPSSKKLSQSIKDMKSLLKSSPINDTHIQCNKFNNTNNIIDSISKIIDLKIDLDSFNTSDNLDNNWED